MKFNVLGREVNVTFSHALYVFGVSMIVGLAMGLVAVVLAVALEGNLSLEVFTKYQLLIAGVFVILNAPLMSFPLLRGAEFAKLKRDAALCRSLATASAILSFVISIISIFAGAAVGIIIPETAVIVAINEIGYIVSIIPETIIFYLWLLFFLKPDRTKANVAALKAAIFVIIYFIVQKMTVVLLNYSNGLPTGVDLALADLSWAAGVLLFGFALLYHMKEKDEKNVYYTFAALYVGGTLLFSLGAALSGDPVWFIGVIERMAELGLIYVLSRKDILKTF